MNILRRRLMYGIALLLCSGMILRCSIGYGFETDVERGIMDLVHRILEQELEIDQLADYNDKRNLSLNSFIYNGKTVQIYVYGTIEHDLNGDGRNDVVVGCEFYDKWEVNTDDFLVVYILGEDNLPKPVFSKRFQQTDKGEFTTFQVKDITGDGHPEIVVRYNFGSVGMNLWEWTGYFYIIRGLSPFDDLLKLSVWERRGSVKKGEYFMNAEVEVKDMDSNGINEIVVVRCEEKNQTQVSFQPEIYRASFKLTSYTFEHLRKKNIPEEILQALQPLEEQEFATNAEFLQAVEQQIGKEDTEKYETLLVQYAIYRYRLEGELQ